MPELPEVENVRISLSSLGAIGQRFSEVELRAAKLRTPLNLSLKAKLPGERIVDLTRRPNLKVENWLLDFCQFFRSVLIVANQTSIKLVLRLLTVGRTSDDRLNLKFFR